MFRRRLFVFCFLMFSLFCLPGQAHTDPAAQAKFDRNLVEELLGPGPATIKGSALVFTPEGGVVSCAGRRVTLAPVTDYSTEVITLRFGDEDAAYCDISKLPNVSEDPDYHKYGLRHTLCDVQGYFEFSGLKPGDYYITAKILWGQESEPLGGMLMRKVSVKGGNTVEIVLSPEAPLLY